MLFDLQGPRKTFVKVIYLGLAILMAGGLVLFGIGSNNAPGGLADVFGGGDSASQAKDNVEKYAKQVQENPQSEKALQSLIAARYTLARDPKNFNQEESTFSQAGQDQLDLLKDNWQTYLKVTDRKPNIGTANFVASAYLGLQDAKGATAVQQIITERQPTAANYLALMLYSSYAGNQIVSSGAEVQALKLASKDEREEVEAQIKEIKERLKDRNAEVQKQIQEQFAAQAQQAAGGGAPSNPFSAAGGAAGGAAPPAGK